MGARGTRSGSGRVLPGSLEKNLKGRGDEAMNLHYLHEATHNFRGTRVVKMTMT